MHADPFLGRGFPGPVPRDELHEKLKKNRSGAANATCGSVWSTRTNPTALIRALIREGTTSRQAWCSSNPGNPQLHIKITCLPHSYSNQTT